LIIFTWVAMGILLAVVSLHSFIYWTSIYLAVSVSVMPVLMFLAVRFIYSRTTKKLERNGVYLVKSLEGIEILAEVDVIFMDSNVYEAFGGELDYPNVRTGVFNVDDRRKLLEDHQNYLRVQDNPVKRSFYESRTLEGEKIVCYAGCDPRAITYANIGI